VVGRALEGDVERHLEAERLASLDEAIEVLERAEPRVDAVWPPSSAPIAHGLPGSPGLARERVVAALAVRCADRVDRRQVETSKPIAAISGSRAAPRGTWRCASGRAAAAERGNISYQAPKRARAWCALSSTSRRSSRGRSGRARRCP
jgi:hypothetical protein